MRPCIVPHQQAFLNVQLHHVNLKSIHANIVPKRPHIVNDRLHLHRALQHPRRSHNL